jgi:hypothetical protein
LGKSDNDGIERHRIRAIGINTGGRHMRYEYNENNELVEGKASKPHAGNGRKKHNNHGAMVPKKMLKRERPTKGRTNKDRRE